MNPYTGMYSGGAIENGLLGAACSEMARYYGLPVEASGGGTDHYIPDAQAAYETSLNSILPVLSWPDILVGPGLLGSSMILSLEKLIIDVEIFRMGAHAQRGILTSSEYWLDDVICRVGPGGNYLGERSTVKALRSGEIYIQELGTHEPLNSWLLDGWDSLLDEARDRVEHILATHRPLPLSAQVEQELARIEQKFTARLAAES
jgi:trimethylamine--corrinoid protein Co-methyltransferase